MGSPFLFGLASQREASLRVKEPLNML